MFTQQSDIDNAVSAAPELFNQIDVLVDNAGYELIGVFEECPIESHTISLRY